MKILKLLCFFLPCVFAFGAKAQPLPFLTNGLVAYYPLNGNANDTSGNGNNGTIQGATFTTDRFGNPSNALYFDGTDAVVVPDSPSLDPTNAITLSAWFNADSLSGNGRIIDKGELQYQMLSEFGNFSFEFVNTSNSDFKLYTTLPTTGTWHQAVETYNGITMATYIDGNLSGSQQANGFVLPHSWSSSYNNNLTIGNQANNPVGSLDAFVGSINDVAIYNRALSPLEVAELYQSSLLAGITEVPGIIVAGNTNQNYSIQYITNASSTNWMTLVSNIVLQGSSPYIYADTNAVGQPQRFYRVVATP